MHIIATLNSALGITNNFILLMAIIWPCAAIASFNRRDNGNAIQVVAVVSLIIGFGYLILRLRLAAH